MSDVYASGSRQIAVDVLRGYFILSMASGHLSNGPLNSLLHIWVWVDGAAGFVCLSGFVLGLSQRAKWEKGVGSAAQAWILRRSAQIWLVATALTVTALLARLYSDDLVFIQDIFADDRLASAIGEILLLQLHVPYFGILGMYVVFLFFAFFAIDALKRNLGWLVLLTSVGVYVLSQWLTMRSPPPELGEEKFIRSAWQILFFMGLVAGWFWQDKLRPMARAAQPWILILSTLGVFIFVTLAHAEKIPVLRDLLDLPESLGKFALRPMVIVCFVLMLAFLASLVELIRQIRITDPLLRAVALFGRHSLACFVILSLMQVASWIVMTPDNPEGARHFAWFVAALVIFTVYCLAAEAKPSRRTGTSRSTVSADEPVVTPFVRLGGEEARGGGGIKRQ